MYSGTKFNYVLYCDWVNRVPMLVISDLKISRTFPWCYINSYHGCSQGYQKTALDKCPPTALAMRSLIEVCLGYASSKFLPIQRKIKLAAISLNRFELIKYQKNVHSMNQDLFRACTSSESIVADDFMKDLGGLISLPIIKCNQLQKCR